MLKQFLLDERGATAIEYGLIAALISVALIAGATSLGKETSHAMWCLNSIVDQVGYMGHPACPNYGKPG